VQSAKGKLSFFNLNFSLFILQCAALDFLDRLADIKIDWAIKDTPSATHTGDPIKVLREIIKLVHDSLPGSFTVRWPWVMT